MMEEAVNSNDWKFESPVFTFLHDNFALQDKEVPVERDSKLASFVYQIGGISLSMSVMLLQTKTEWVYVTAGFANMMLLHERRANIPMEKRKHGKELVFRLKKTDDEMENSRKKHPSFPTDLLKELCNNRFAEPIPPCEANTRVIVPNVVPRTHRRFSEVITKRFFFAQPEGVEDEPWTDLLKDSHGDVRFLFICGMTEDEKAWAKRNSIAAFVKKARSKLPEGVSIGVNDIFRPSYLK